MALLDAADLTEAGSVEGLLRSAQRAVEVYCFGRTGLLLADAPAEDAIRLRVPGPLAYLRVGPASALLEVRLSGVDRTADFELASPFGIRVRPSSDLGVIPAGALLQVRVQQGWDEENVPEELVEAMLLLARDPAWNPARRAVKQERLGDVSLTYQDGAGGGPGGLTAGAAALLGPWRDPALLGV